MVKNRDNQKREMRRRLPILATILVLEVVASVTLICGRALGLDCRWLIWLFASVIALFSLWLVFLAWATVRRRFQFGLSTVLVIMLAFGAGPGSLVAFVRQSRPQRVAGARFVQLEAQVAWAIDGRRGLNLLPGRHHFSSVSNVSFLFCPPAENADLALFEELTELRGAIILGEGFSDRHLQHFEGLAQLEFLVLHFASVSGPGLKSLQGLPDLRVLGLANSLIEDEGGEWLSRCESLETLGLAETRIGDNGIAHLTRMPNLSDLQLNGTLVTDAGLPYLKSIRGLTKLDLSDTRVTKPAIARLQKQLPDCEIVW